MLLLALLRDEARLRPRVGPIFAWIYRHTAAKVDVLQQARDTIQRVSYEVADGNRKVFKELAPLFVRFVEAMRAPEPERAAIQHDWQCLATRLTMRLSLPAGRVLPLGGEHIPWPNQIPDVLAQNLEHRTPRPPRAVRR